MKRNQKSTDYKVSIRSILSEIKTANPGVSVNEIVAELRSLIVDVMPLAIRNVRISRKPLSPFELKRREFLNIRRSKALKDKREQISDLESLLRDAQSSIYEQYSSDRTVTLMSSRGASPEVGSKAMISVFSGYSGTPDSLSYLHHNLHSPVKTNELQDLSSYGPESDSEIATVASGSKAPKPLFLIDPFLGIEGELTLSEVRLISTVETETRKIYYEISEDISFNLTRIRPNLGISQQKLVLQIVPSGHTSLKELNFIAETLEERIKSRLTRLAESLKPEARIRLENLTELFSVRLDLSDHSDWLTINDFQTFRTNRYKDTIQILRKKTAEHELLMFKDIEKIIDIFRASDSSPLVEDVLSCLTEDIRNRKLIYGTNCLEELYRGESNFPEQARLKESKSYDINDLIREAIRAISLNEYENQHARTRDDLIKKKITYQEFQKRIREHMADAVKIWSDS